MCGENLVQNRVMVAVSGSSPRVRGKLCWSKPQELTSGLIPACAGKTPTRPLRRHNVGAHPRVCGENIVCGGWFRCGLGSSPRVRGKLRRLQEVLGTTGLIPACAGKTFFGEAFEEEFGAHPRVCGENRGALAIARGARGSSPRVRGKLIVRAGCAARGRLIPACAGKTGLDELGYSLVWAHPRVCGENHKEKPCQTTPPGSSPRVRGKLRLQAL